ncbi:MAG TPA: polynucleotide adenylyltransferase PcnB [Burkholderiales bacterium]|nr:polynucleotide adenylyltransferase PcnB [Burkholderiales bacterium]
MIRKIIRRIFDKNGPSILPLAKHGIHREDVSSCARKVTSSLQEAGFSAFIVGGAVRDLVLGKKPKDFDVATDADPDEVRALFRRSRIIGRRFRLVHVMCGAEVIEVSTFRRSHGSDEESDGRTDVHGRVLADNVFGNQEEDAQRRDFTINALFYDPSTEEIWDFHDGFSDLKASRIRMIGDPETRYREDPVRMLRAVRFAAKLGMKLDRKTELPIKTMGELLQHVPAARLFEEMLKLLMSGHSVECILELRRAGLHHGLLPMLDVILEQPMGERFIMAALKNTDDRISEEKPVSPAFLFASLLWHEVLTNWKSAQEKGGKPIPALYEAMDLVLDIQQEKLAIPRRYTATMKEIWSLQPRFQQRSGRRPFQLLEHPRFRAAYDFLILRVASGEVEPETGKWWETFQDASGEEREGMLVAEEAPKRRRRRRRPRAAEA